MSSRGDEPLEYTTQVAGRTGARPYTRTVSPGGHLVTTLAACGAAAALTESWPAVAGVAAGGFLIDVDHAVDYVVFDGQRDLRPGAFLRHYVDGDVQRVVLLLHSYELLAILAVAGWWTGWVALWGYLAGAVMHLALDMIFNGGLLPGNVVGFYSFAYRARRGFSGPALVGRAEREAAPESFWRAFFRGAVPAVVTVSRER